MEQLFVYGTLRDPQVRENLLKRKLSSSPDKIKDFKKNKVIIEGEIYPIIVHEKDGIVEGDIINVSKNELKILDEHETDAYKRIKVKTINQNDVWVYIKNYK